MNFKKSEIKNLIEELETEGLVDRMRGIPRKLQQATGIARKPWTHRGPYNAGSIVVDELLSDLYKRFPEMSTVWTRVRIESYAVEEIDVAKVTSELFHALVSIDPESGDAQFNQLSVYGRGMSAMGVNPKRRPVKQYKHLDFDAGETILHDLFQKVAHRYASYGGSSGLNEFVSRVDWGEWPPLLASPKEFCIYAKNIGMDDLCSMQNLRGNWKSYRDYVKAHRDVTSDMPQVSKAASPMSNVKRKIKAFDKATGNLRRMKVMGKGFGVQGKVTFEGQQKMKIKNSQIEKIVQEEIQRLEESNDWVGKPLSYIRGELKKMGIKPKGAWWKKLRYSHPARVKYRAWYKAKRGKGGVSKRRARKAGKKVGKFIAQTAADCAEDQLWDPEKGSCEDMTADQLQARVDKQIAAQKKKDQEAVDKMEKEAARRREAAKRRARAARADRIKRRQAARAKRRARYIANTNPVTRAWHRFKSIFEEGQINVDQIILEELAHVLNSLEKKS